MCLIVISCNLDLSNCFLMVRFRLNFFGKAVHGWCLPFSVLQIKRLIMLICPIIGDAEFNYLKFSFPLYI